MATKEQLIKIRKGKLKSIKSAGLSPYPLTTKRTHTIAGAIKAFSTISKAQKEIILVGRIRLLRIHGGSTFIQFEDGTGNIQAFFRKDRLGEKGYQFFFR